MCGIVGYIGPREAYPIIIKGLKRLEYRGYDSAGLATLSEGIINEVKSEGRVENLEKNIAIKNMQGSVGIGHVRWATHGIPNTVNAHPHSSNNVSIYKLWSCSWHNILTPSNCTFSGIVTICA